MCSTTSMCPTSPRRTYPCRAWSWRWRRRRCRFRRTGSRRCYHHANSRTPVRPGGPDHGVPPRLPGRKSVDRRSSGRREDCRRPQRRGVRDNRVTGARPFWDRALRGVSTEPPDRAPPAQPPRAHPRGIAWQQARSPGRSILGAVGLRPSRPTTHRGGAPLHLFGRHVLRVRGDKPQIDSAHARILL